MQSVFIPLVVFKDSLPHSPQYGIKARASREGQILTFEFKFTGNFDDSIVFSPEEISPKRMNELWTSTCFEAFFGWEKEPEYWELNLAPSGNWNCYTFESYRSFMREEKEVVLLRKELKLTRGHFLIEIQLPPDLLVPDEPLFIGLSAVIEEKGKEPGQKNIRYWSLAHAEDHPDFHNRVGFRLTLTSDPR